MSEDELAMSRFARLAFPASGAHVVRLRAQAPAECAIACNLVGDDKCDAFAFSRPGGTCTLLRAFRPDGQVATGLRTVTGALVTRSGTAGTWGDEVALREWLPAADDPDKCGLACDWRASTCRGYLFDGREGAVRPCTLLEGVANQNDESFVRIT